MPVEKILVTGVAGFIGYHVAQRLVADGQEVVGIDNLNTYYEPLLKQARLARVRRSANFEFMSLDIADQSAMEDLFSQRLFSCVIHLAAQAGVRYSLANPHVYAESNLTGFLHVLEGVRRSGIRHLVYASSSSVYGGNTKVPFSAVDRVDQPMSFYAVTKRANELMAHCYTHLFNISTTGLRFFTVYGPWGRPDMAPSRFADAILRGRPIEIYNFGMMRRDFTYIDDVVEGVVRIARGSPAGYRLFNVGNSQPVELMTFIAALERALGRRADKRFLPLQAGDVVTTHADVADFWDATGFRPTTPLNRGIENFARWYMDYYGDVNDDDGSRPHARSLLQTS